MLITASIIQAPHCIEPFNPKRPKREIILHFSPLDQLQEPTQTYPNSSIKQKKHIQQTICESATAVESAPAQSKRKQKAPTKSTSVSRTPYIKIPPPYLLDLPLKKKKKKQVIPLHLLLLQGTHSSR